MDCIIRISNTNEILRDIPKISNCLFKVLIQIIFSLNVWLNVSITSDNTWKSSLVDDSIVKSIAGPSKEADDLSMDHNPNGLHDKYDIQVLLDPYGWLIPKVGSFPLTISSYIFFVSDLNYRSLRDNWMLEYSIKYIQNWQIVLHLLYFLN